MIGGARGVSSSPLEFGDDRTNFNPGVKVNAKMNKPLVINEGGLLLKKQNTEVASKGKGILLDDNLEAFGSTEMVMLAKGEMASSSSSNSKTGANKDSIAVGRFSVSCVKKGSQSKGANGPNESDVNGMNKVLAAEGSIHSDLEEVRKCITGDLARCDEVNVDLPNRPNLGNQ
ncbi:hypothetical protein MA16_Dca018311 [Dendrobium catenatum]|uniref:Uncharacterized protein n=1 Tax=Dendrobium catenatum TaxID=906689 RepID=A0A2I0WJG3_9ASPA|nr:hypothetical protein MA16_Dca018311 [Dendrobium catenatum]